MRKIKFRAWSKEKNIMCYNNEDGDADWCDGTYGSLLGVINDFLTAERYDFMQYTGLKDKNGKEIYEGDILKQNGLIRVVQWEMSCGSCCSQVIGFSASGEGHTDFIELSRPEIIEVIGNIYDNPELLEKV